MQFVIPNTSLGSVLQHFQGITPNQDHFSLIEAPLHAFIETEFIKTFIKDGNLLLIFGKIPVSKHSFSVISKGVSSYKEALFPTWRRTFEY